MTQPITTYASFGPAPGVGYLSPVESAPIFARASRTSVVQRLARQVPLGRRGSVIPIFGTATAEWVGELERKPVSDLTKTIKSMKPQKIATVFVMSKEAFSENPAGFATEVRRQAGDAIGKAFDSAILYGTNSPFPESLADSDKTVALGTATASQGGIRKDLINGLKLLVDDGKKLTGFALDDTVEPELLGAVDNNGQPIWREYEQTELSADEALGAARRGTLLARPSWMQEGIGGGTTAAVGGDWTQLVWGVASGITFSVSTEASVTMPDGTTVISLWQNNAVGILCEAEYGFVVGDVNAFVNYTASTSS